MVSQMYGWISLSLRYSKDGLMNGWMDWCKIEIGWMNGWMD